MTNRDRNTMLAYYLSLLVTNAVTFAIVNYKLSYILERLP